MKDLDLDLTGRHVLLVEDIVDSGLTLQLPRTQPRWPATRPASRCAPCWCGRARQTGTRACDYVGLPDPARLRHRLRPRRGRALPQPALHLHLQRRAPDVTRGQADEPTTVPPVDQPRIEAAVREILAAIGEDPDRDGLQRHPGPGGPHVRGDLRRPPGDARPPPAGHLRGRPRRDGHGPRHRRWYSICEHHLVPFIGQGPRGLHPQRRRPDHRPVQAGPPGRRLRPAAPGPGAADHPDRRRDRAHAPAQGRDGGHRGRAPVHVDAGRAQAGRPPR